MEWQTMSDGSRILWDCMRPVLTRANYARTHATIRTGSDFRATIRAGAYAWPGGYPMALLMSDGEVLCFDCGRSEAPAIIRSIRNRSRDGWKCEGVFIHYEGEVIHCAHCGKSIPSAYGSDEGVDQ